MKIKEKAIGDFLYHPVHGMCRIERLIRQDGQKNLSYSLVPKTAGGMKVRFVIAAEQMEEAGFHGPVSVKEANDILAYLKAGDGRAAQTRRTWMLAQTLLVFYADKFSTREQRKRQALEYSAKGLIGELSSVLNITMKEAADMVMKNLGQVPQNNLSVLAALTRAGED